MRLLPLVALLACTSSTGPAGETDADTDTDTDADTDTDTDTDTDADAGPCPAYSGITRVGATRTMATTPEAEAEYGSYGELTTVITAIDGETIRTAMTGEWDVPNTEDYVVSSESELRCDADGMWFVWSRYEWSYRSGGETYTGWSESDYTSYLSVPRDLGDGWTVDFTSSTVDSFGNETDNPESVVGVGRQPPNTAKASRPMRESRSVIGKGSCARWRSRSAEKVAPCNPSDGPLAVTAVSKPRQRARGGHDRCALTSFGHGNKWRCRP